MSWVCPTNLKKHLLICLLNQTEVNKTSSGKASAVKRAGLWKRYWLCNGHIHMNWAAVRGIQPATNITVHVRRCKRGEAIAKKTTFTNADIILVKVIHTEHIQESRAAQVECSLWWHGGCWFYSRSLLTTCPSVEWDSKPHTSSSGCVFCVWTTTGPNGSSVFCKRDCGRMNAHLEWVQNTNAAFLPFTVH